MLKFVALAAVGAISAAGAAQAVVMLNHSAPQPSAQTATAQAVAPTPVEEEPASGPPSSIAKASDGHYWAEADVNGRAVHFLVDTGATTVALTTDDARRLGFAPADLDYRYEVSTANGKARAAKIELASISVAGARVNDVEALVIEQGLSSSLLGMTYLGRLSRFEATRNALILRP